MSETPKNKDQEKGDEVLKRMLKTPPKPKKPSCVNEHKKDLKHSDKGEPAK